MAVTTVARRRRQSPARRAANTAHSMQGREIAGLGLIGLGVFLGMTLFLGVSVGPLGSGLETLIRFLVGRAVLLAPLLFVLGGLGLIFHWRILDRRPFRAGAITLGATLLLALAAGSYGVGGRTRDAWFDPTVMQGRGGIIGEFEYFVTSNTVGASGTNLLVMLGFIAGLILVTGASLSLVLRRSGKGAAVASRAVGRSAKAVTLTAVRGGQILGEQVRTRFDARDEPTVALARTGDQAGASPLDGADHFPDLFTTAGTLPRSPALGPREGDAPDALEERPAPSAPRHTLPVADEDDGYETPPPPPLETLIPPANPQRGYRPPSTKVLKRSTGPTTQPASVIQETSRRLVETLGHFGIQAEVTEAVSGPRVTRYELQLAPGTKVSRVTALRDDLAYALAAREEIRIIAPIPGKQAVGVEVANPNATMVTLGDLFRDFPENAGPLMSWLGIDIGGSAVYLDLARMPHILIAGSTGTGKSVCLNAILASILLRSTPDDLRMILIDPKKVELNHYEGIPHLLTPVVTNMKNASAVLANVVREMESRYELMGQDRARNLRDWNATRLARGDKQIPTILVLIDELADLMMVAPAEVEDAIIRLAQKSRAVGIHLVLATQRPSVDVITGMIKANVPSRIAFAVSSQIDSRVVLDATGAESLLGSGDMLFRPIGTSRLQRLQGAYVSEEEILAITDHWRRQGKPELRDDLLERPEVPDDDPLDPDADDLIGKACDLVVTQGTASVSLLQRRLGVGYARAGRLVDMMERMGVISGHEGSKPRTVLVGEGDLDRIFRRGEPADADAADDDID
jgi:S-DNA-T family DNA segregation ATPase FtsK/SpoIIIE